MMIKTRLHRAAVVLVVIALFGNTHVFGQTKKKMKISDITFSGVTAFRENQLRKVMVTRSSNIFKKYRFNQEIFEEDLTSLELLYRQNGYLEAKIENYRLEPDSTDYKISLHIVVSEGGRTFIEGISLLGNSVYPDSLLLSNIKFKNGDGAQKNLSVDMVILSCALVPDGSTSQVAKILGVELDDRGFFQTSDINMGSVETIRSGIFVAGCAEGPKDAKSAVMQAESAAAMVMKSLLVHENMIAE